jgi:riboflavin kinase/FMN adenylyltransferase
MEIWSSILQARKDILSRKTGSILTIGNFDGVHLGHQTIIGRTVEKARQEAKLALALTFGNHSASLWGEKPLLINLPEFRRELLNAQHLDALLEVEFDENFAALEPEVFFQTWIVEGLQASALVVGHDFRFGRTGRGNYEILRQLGKLFGVIIERVDPVRIEGSIVSSSLIRELLAEGRLELANRMLGYYFRINGLVVRGEGRGRRLGYPTANIHLLDGYLLPCYGVYLVKLEAHGRSYYGLANVGINPTFGIHTPRIEVYLFDIELNLYDQPVRIDFLRFIRPENRFAGPEALKAQIARDVAAARRMLSDGA